MGHLSLYRKYRPQAFGEVAGQEHVTRTLQNALTEGRIAHAYLFNGPRGTGKTTAARILAKALNCERGPAAEPCNECPSCQGITAGSSLDVVEIDAASHGSVDDARDLRDKVASAPVGGRWKVYIVDECHMLTTAANNALLKVLEEPPSHVVFVFATTEPHKVLQTLLDRCQRYEFRAISPEAVAERVRQVCTAEGIAAEDDAVQMIASRAGGSMRDALSLLEQLTSYSGTRVAADDVMRLLGSLPEDLLFEAVDLVSDRDAGGCFVFADRLIRSGRDLREFVRALVEHLRSLFLVQHASRPEEILDVSDERLERLRAQANRFEPAELLRVIDLAGETQLALRQPVDARLVLEVGLARMARPELHAAPASVLARVERLERLAGIEPADVLAREAPPRAAPVREAPHPARPTARPRPAEAPAVRPPAERREEDAPPAPQEAPAQPAPVAAAPVAGGPLDLDRILRAWDVVLAGVKKRKISTQAMLLPATPVAWEDGELILEFGPKHRFHRDQISDASHQAPLAEAFHDTFGIRPKVRCVLGVEERPHHQPAPAAAGAGGPSPAITSGGGELGDGPPAAPPSGEWGAKSAVDLVREGFGAEIVEEF